VDYHQFATGARTQSRTGAGDKRFSDIGSGAGYFLYICQWLGIHHRLDIDDVPMYGEMFQALGLKRVLGGDCDSSGCQPSNTSSISSRPS